MATRTTSRRTRTPNSFSLERLENRQLMAADVGVYFDSAGLHIVEGAGFPGGPQAIEISHPSASVIRVTGLAAVGGGTTQVNGHAFQDFPASGDVSINLGGGNDTVVFDEHGYTGSDRLFGNVSVAVGSPTGTGPDADTVRFSGAKAKGNVTVLTGAGNDTVSLDSVMVGTAGHQAPLTVATGAGADSVRLGSVVIQGNLNIYAFDQLSEADADAVTVSNTASSGAQVINTGGGNDVVTLSQNFSQGNSTVSTGDGDDQLTMRDTTSKASLFAMLGNGNDRATVAGLNVTGTLSLDGGAGIDSLDWSLLGQLGQNVWSNWETLNGRPNPRAVAAPLATTIRR